MTFTQQTATNLYAASVMFGMIDIPAMIVNAVSAKPWNWRIKQQVADKIMLELLHRGAM